MRTLVKQLRFNNSVLYRPQDSAAVKIMVVVIGVFLVCSAFRFCCGFTLLSNGNNIKILIVVLNSGVNPLAYALFKIDIKKELKRLKF